MAFYDNDTNRRNLIITSLGFIIYYKGNGTIDGDFKIQAFNVTLRNVEFLSVGAVIMLLWFVLRYWQAREKDGFDILKENICLLKSNKSLSKYIKNNQNAEKHIKGKGFYTDAASRSNLPFSITEIDAKRFNGKWKITICYPDSEYYNIILNDVKGKFLIIKLLLAAIIKKSVFTSYYAPYLIFYYALYLISCNYVSNI